MLETATKVNLKVAAAMKTKPLIVQIYEVQDPAEARAMIELGVDHIGSVVVSENRWKNSPLKDAIDLVRPLTAKSCLIPLFSRPEAVMRTLDYYQPDMVHFCEALAERGDNSGTIERLIQLQKDVKKQFPQIQIMRSIPIGPPGRANLAATLQLSRKFEPVSDFFLTDTLLPDSESQGKASQPVNGFVGITGRICDWDVAARLVQTSGIPVILAGGISPDNVQQAIRQVRPYGVDSCTLTNALDEAGQPIRFKKDRQKVKQLIEVVRKAKTGLI